MPEFFIHWLAVPTAVGNVNARLEVAVAPLCNVTVLLLVLLLKIILPLLAAAVPNVSPPLPSTTRAPLLRVMTDALSLKIEFTSADELLNFGNRPAVPPTVVTAPLKPLQLPSVVQTV